MSYQDPKTDWTEADTFKTDDTNRIEGNIEYLAGDGEQPLGTNDNVTHADLTVDSLTSSGEVQGSIGTFSGSVVCGSINTGSGAFEIGQDLRTTDAVTFATVNTGQGANELYAMNQPVRTTDSPTFISATVNGGKASAHYTGSTQGETNLPVGSVVLVRASSGSPVLNGVIAVYVNTSNNEYVNFSGSGSVLMSGTWRVRGNFLAGNYYYLAQRIS